jgi:hypothetical protein
MNDSTFRALYLEWMGLSETDRSPLQERLSSQWRSAWAESDTPTRGAILRFIAHAGIDEGRALLRDCAYSFNQDIRDSAIEAFRLVVWFNPWPINDLEAMAIRAYFSDYRNRMRTIAFEVLAKANLLTSSDLESLSEFDPSIEVRMDSRDLLRKSDEASEASP